ncbi:hypothetical protein C9439_05005 [archaeon SCG-AAA382B04]|nr:hypothetical protein C9439_05005 [archaeon SCG-AAA382B04]
MNIAWGITGAGSHLTNTIKAAKKISTKNKITFFVSEAGEEVLKTYGLFDELNQLVSNEYLDEIIRETTNTVSTSKIGRFMLGKYDYLIVSPTTSNTVAKMAHGISDTLVTNVFTSATKSDLETIVLAVDKGKDVSKSPMTLEKEKCQKCQDCPPKQKCPNNAIHQYQINLSKCNKCKLCVEICRHSAIGQKEIILEPRKTDSKNIRELNKTENVRVVQEVSKIIDLIDS